MQQFILLLIGLSGLIWVGLSTNTHKLLFNTIKILLNGVKTKGVVKSITSTKDSDGAIQYLIDIEFRDAKNETIVFQPVKGSYKPDAGDEVVVKYEVSNPKNALLHQFQTYAWVLLQVGLLLFIFSMWSYQLVMLVVKRN